MIENTSTKILYSTDGTNKVFDIPFDFINNEDVVISVKLPTDTDFTKITENYLVNKAMATVTYPVSGNALVADSSVLIERNTPVTQLESSAKLHFTSSDVERGLDKITMIAQEIKNSTSGLTGVVVLTKIDLTKSARSDSQRVNIGTRAYKFITLELNSADGYLCSPMHSSAGYGKRSGNFATIKVEIDAAEFTDNLIIKNGGDTFGYKVTLWY